jgi:hypothetical protein
MNATAEPLPYMTPRLERWRRVTDGPLLVLAIGSLPLLPLELKRTDLAHGDRVFVDASTSSFVLAAFAADCAIELALATNRGTYVPSEWTSAAIVVSQALGLVSQALGVVPALGGFGVLRAPWYSGVPLVRSPVATPAIGGAAASEGRSVLPCKAARMSLSQRLCRSANSTRFPGREVRRHYRRRGRWHPQGQSLQSMVHLA